MQKKGISLIVLVITIIVMIILAASVVITLSNTGVIGRASQAVDATNEAQVQDLAALVWADAYMNGKRGSELETIVKKELDEQGVKETDWNITVTDTGVTINSSNITGSVWRVEREYDENGLITKVMVTDGTMSYEVGTTVNYMPNGVGPTSYKGGWKLLGVDDKGRLLIMSSNNITGSDLILTGEDGFINGLTTIQNAVSGYKDGTMGVEVRSVTAEDLGVITGYNQETYTGEEFLQRYVKYLRISGEKGTDEELEAIILDDMVFASKGELALYDKGMLITYSWNGTDYPNYSYEKNGVVYTMKTQPPHSNGFRYYDSKANTFKVVPKADSGEIVTIETDSEWFYIGDGEYNKASKAYKMLFETSDGTDMSKYLLASRAVWVDEYCLRHGFGSVYDGVIEGLTLVNSYSDYFENTQSYEIRAVVTLNSGITLKANETLADVYDIAQ